MNKITVGTIIQSPLNKVWEFWNESKHITHWYFASDDWECPTVINNVKENGKFNFRMQAKDGSFGFNLSGTYIKIEDKKYLEYVMDGEDKRQVKITFEKLNENETKVTEEFDPETLHPLEFQKAGWQAILDNFKKYVEHN